jgi:hypothetical protein
MVSIKLNPSSTQSDKIVSNTGIKLEDCYFFLSKLDETSYKAGAEYKILEAPVIEGNVVGIIPSSPGDGLKWDISELNSRGILRVALETGLNVSASNNQIKTFPNPVKEVLNVYSDKAFINASSQLIDATGRTCYIENKINGNHFQFSINSLKSGNYTLVISSENLVSTFIIIKT